MALFSEIDWVILLGIGAFLLFGQGNGAALRQMGRWYGRAMKLKQELLSEFTRAADLPVPSGGRPYSIRQAILESDPVGGRVSGIPVAVTTPPGYTSVTISPSPAALAALGPETWSMARPSPTLEPWP
jgi:hypothetical protein